MAGFGITKAPKYGKAVASWVKGKLSPKDFGNVLVGIASEYNDALLIVENANIFCLV